MKIKWTNSDNYYDTELDKDVDKKEAIKQLILKILELSENRESWNLIVLDKWVFNLGRLIGNIQNVDEPIGLDRGYRVAIQFLDYYERLEKSSNRDYDVELRLINRNMEKIIIDVIQDEDFKSQLMTFYKANPFTIEIAEQGERIGRIFNVV